MTCCSRMFKNFNSKVAPEAPEAGVLYDQEEVEAALKKRPERNGIFLLCHKSQLAEIQHEAKDFIVGEAISIWDEFFSMHPSRHDICKEFVSLCFTPNYVDENPASIRMASYRWLDVKGVGNEGKSYQAPSNYVWFLEWLKENKKLGWMDFMANIVVNVRTIETVNYMGGFFARLQTIAEWMLRPELLEQGLHRAWIFQETAFGGFDSSGISIVLDEIRQIGLALLNNSDSSSFHTTEDKLKICHKFADKCEHMAKLLDRRGYFAYAAENEESLLRERQYEYYRTGPYEMSSNVTLTILSRVFGDEKGEELLFSEEGQKLYSIVESGYSKGYTAMYHLCDFFTLQDNDTKFDACRKALHNLCTLKTWLHADTSEAFVEQIGDPLLSAYSALHVSYEEDRAASVTKVAMAIMESDYGLENMDYEAFCHSIWKGAADLCLKTSFKSDGFIRSSTIVFQPCIPKGKRFLGGIKVGGSRFDGKGMYKTALGETYAQRDWIPGLVIGWGVDDFEYDEAKRVWKREKEAKEIYFDLYFCEGVKNTTYCCGVVAAERHSTEIDDDDVKPTCAWFYTSPAALDYPAPAQETIFC